MYTKFLLALLFVAGSIAYAETVTSSSIPFSFPESISTSIDSRAKKPGPAKIAVRSGNIHLQWKTPAGVEQSTVEAISGNGRVLLRKVIRNSNYTSIALSDVSSALVLIRITSGNSRLEAKVVAP
jgi:hypothetical protein